MRTLIPRLCLLLAMLTAAPAGAAEIAWQVESPFRFLDSPEANSVHREVYAGLSEVEKLEPVLSAERVLMGRYPQGWAKTMFESTCWVPERNSYGPCPSGAGYMRPTSHRILAGLRSDVIEIGECEWVLVPVLAGNDAPAQRIRSDCRQAVALDVPYPDGGRLAVYVDGQLRAESTVKVTDLLIVGLGDSIASGEGNPDQPVAFDSERDLSYGTAPGGAELAGYPARVGDWTEIGDDSFLASGPRWLSQACHRSLYSYQTRVALQLALEDPHRAITYLNYACAGAEVINGLMVSYSGTEWARDPPDRSQINAVALAQCDNFEPPGKSYQNTYSLNGVLPGLENIVLTTCPREQARKIDLLMLSIGGNDVGFARLVANAILADKGILRKLGGWMGQVEEAGELIARLPELELRYKALNRALHAHLQIPWSESDRVLLTAYPVMALEDDGENVCADGQLGMTVFPEFDLSREKTRQSEKAAERLNRTMRKAAKTFGWTYVEGHRQSFAGHGICASGTAGGLADDIDLPRKVAGAWVPYNPSEYRPYVPRRRWFRTPNDAFLTGNYHIASSVLKQVLKLQSIEWFQLVLAGTYSGAFHPTSEGQAVIADAVLPEARAVLAKYARRSGGRGVPRVAVDTLLNPPGR